jgi:hypothetical protein
MELMNRKCGIRNFIYMGLRDVGSSACIVSHRLISGGKGCQIQRVRSPGCYPLVGDLTLSGPTGKGGKDINQ